MTNEDTRPSNLTEVEVSCPPANKSLDPDAEKENRRLRHWVIRCLIGTMSVAFLFMVIAIIYAFVFQQREMEKTVLGEFLSIFGEVIKIVATPQ